MEYNNVLLRKYDRRFYFNRLRVTNQKEHSEDVQRYLLSVSQGDEFLLFSCSQENRRMIILYQSKTKASGAEPARLNNSRVSANPEKCSSLMRVKEHTVPHPAAVAKVS